MEEILPILRGLERSWRLAQVLNGELMDRLPLHDRLPEQNSILSRSLESLWGRMLDMLKVYRLTLIDPKGDPFNRKLCLPITVRGGTQFPEGTVVEVLAFGYRFNGRVLAQAEVVIAANP